MAAWPQHGGPTIVSGNRGTEQKKMKTEERSNLSFGKQGENR